MMRYALAVAALYALCIPLAAAGMTARDVTGLLFKSAVADRPDLAGQDLANLELSNLDFHNAKLMNARLFGADLSQSDLSGTDLSGADMDRVTLISTKFDEANLEGARLLRPSVFSTLAAAVAEAPSFRKANMRGIKMFGRFTRANFEGADLTGATCAPFGKTGFIEEIWRTELSGANLAGAILVRADLTHALLTFADMRGANLTNAILKNADFTGADLTGANASGADFEGAILKDVKGFNTIIGLSEAKNINKMLR
jgi:uncharacterized protein YjbI with pentapeptide repeats